MGASVSNPQNPIFRIRFQVLNSSTRRYYRQTCEAASIGDCIKRYDLSGEDFEILSVDQIT